MAELFRDTVVGQMLRLITGRRILQYPEERDASIVQKYLNSDNSANTAIHGTTNPPPTEEKEESAARPQTDGAEQTPSGRPPSRSSSTTLEDGSHPVNIVGGQKTDPEKGRDADMVDWYGPDDPENPRNWSTPKKFWVTFEICLLTFSVYVGSAIYSAGITDVSSQFGVSKVAATLGLTLFVLGYGIGPMLWSPMSEVPQIGRGPIYIGTLALFVILQVPTALATNFGMLLAFRFLTGFVGSPSLATGGASIGDMYSPAKRTYGLAVWGIGAVCGPVLGPLIGGFAAESEGWTWTIWELMWLSGFTLVLLTFLLPETSSANILYRRTMRLRRLTGNQKLVCEPQLLGEQMTGRDIVMMVLVRPFTLSFTEPMVFLLNMYIALIYGILYIWFESFPIVFTGIYGFSLGLEGTAFLGIFVGVLITLPPFVWYQMKYIEPKFNEKGELQPEWRLPPSFVGAFAIPICLFWFGWSSRPEIHWIMPIIGTGFFSIGSFLMFNSALNYLADAYPQYAASVLAGNDLFRSSVGAGFPLFATAMYNNLGVGWASSTLAFLAIAFIPIPFLLFKYGERLRRLSKYAQKDY
ncbi:hypothetical protein A1O1_02528 [Capronia coronata CBS 617.96]|uniref:Major facilitator superfamily (MFS) profile domain-containing protein n=1 Tax=Capronia coronata CBS 617.96 TaxID=1182541 RepID=W9YWS2_9EURO|nr:uncharacterized protein A1O1_02528 [Capronia coronata CBS 617.96]EXJ94135.1 hypothetical protein A1O1_02528 [Capronia coronata CBS 617.96]